MHISNKLLTNVRECNCEKIIVILRERKAVKQCDQMAVLLSQYLSIFNEQLASEY